MEFIEKFEKLPEDVQNVFASNAPRLAIEKACFLYGINEDEIGKVSSIVSDIFIRNIELRSFPIGLLHAFISMESNIAYGIAYEISKDIFKPLSAYFSECEQLIQQWQSKRCLPLVSDEKVQKRIYELEPWILEEQKEEREQKEKEESVKEYISISEMFAKYPQLAEVSVSSNPLRLKYSPDLVKPSIKNWITDYRETLGNGKHDAIERGKYLFQGENGKRLNNGDRQKLSVMFKSLEENLPLEYDKENNTINFEIKNISAQNAVQHGISQSNFSQQKPIERKNLSENFSSNNAQKIDNYFSQKSKPNFQNEFNLEKQQEIANQDYFASYKKENKNNFSEKKEEQPANEIPRKQQSPDFSSLLKSENPIVKLSSSQNDQTTQQKEPKDIFSKFGLGSDKYFSTKKDEDKVVGTLSFSNPQKLPTERKDF